MISVQSVPDPSSVDLREASLMLPVPGLQANSIHLEPRDGPNIETLTAQGVTLQRNGAPILRVRNVRITVFITDARVAVACSKYDKGGGWIGTPTAMVVANTVSKSLAAIRRHGKMLVGQVRYQWVSGVGSTHRLGMGTSERLILEAKADSSTSFRLTLLLPKNTDGAAIAARIAGRAARYRLVAEPLLAEEKRAALGLMVNARPLPPAAKNTITFHRAPDYYFMNVASARISPPDMDGGHQAAASARPPARGPGQPPGVRGSDGVGAPVRGGQPSGTHPSSDASVSGENPPKPPTIVISLGDL
jgi:hypothetical protein